MGTSDYFTRARAETSQYDGEELKRSHILSYGDVRKKSSIKLKESGSREYGVMSSECAPKLF